MKYLLIGLSCLTFAYGQWNNCPPSGCPLPQRPINCGAPDCSILTNRYHENALFPIFREPTMYWQCAPVNATHWAGLQRHCACGTVFNPNVNPPRCTFWYESTWFPDTTCGWTSPPLVRECEPECPNCGAPGPQVTPQPPPGNPVTPAPPNECPCPCPPCIWWPCTPCQPQNNCACNSQRG